jgi:hypothetical protein
MDNTVSIKINLAQLKHALMTTPKGTKCIVIPIDENSLFESEKGNVYLDLIAFKLKEAEEDRTHLIKQSFSKEVRDKMTEEEKMKQSIIGNLKIWDEVSRKIEPEPNRKQEKIADSVNELPF